MNAHTNTAPEGTEYHHGDLPNALLASLGELVDETGSADVSLREIARRAGVSHSAPAHHFGDKEGMLLAFCGEGADVLAAELQAARGKAEGRGSLERIGEVGAAYVRFAVNHRAYFHVMFRSGLDYDQQKEHFDASEGAFGVLMETVADFLAENEIPGVDPRIVAVYFWSLSHGLASLAVDDNLPSGLSELSIDDYISGVFSMTSTILSQDS